MLFLVISTFSPRLERFCSHSSAVIPCTSVRMSCGMGGLLLTPGIQESSTPAWGEKSPLGWEEHGAELGGLTFTGGHCSEEERAARTLASEVTAELY